MTNLLLTIIAIPHFFASLLIFKGLYDVIQDRTNKLFDFGEDDEWWKV
jgi:hypothetical protein